MTELGHGHWDLAVGVALVGLGDQLVNEVLNVGAEYYAENLGEKRQFEQKIENIYIDI